MFKKTERRKAAEETAKKLLPVIQAFAEGKDIEFKGSDGVWRSMEMLTGIFGVNVRIAPANKVYGTWAWEYTEEQEDDDKISHTGITTFIGDELVIPVKPVSNKNRIYKGKPIFTPYAIDPSKSAESKNIRPIYNPTEAYAEIAKLKCRCGYCAVLRDKVILNGIHELANYKGMVCGIVDTMLAIYDNTDGNENTKKDKINHV